MRTFGTTLGLEFVAGAIPRLPRAWRASLRLRNLATATEARRALGSGASKFVILARSLPPRPPRAAFSTLA
jgi:hypothetical protein